MKVEIENCKEGKMTMKNKLLEMMKNYPLDFEDILFSKSNQDAFQIAQRLIPNYTIEEFRKDFKEVEKDPALDIDQLDKVIGGANINWSPTGDLVQEDPFYKEKSLD
ncbi:MAG: hypothetical protein LBT69_02525 [Lactobacillales bacterium]|nr:hypothetical protein [Lactobacillales bacterium]